MPEQVPMEVPSFGSDGPVDEGQERFSTTVREAHLALLCWFLFHAAVPLMLWQIKVAGSPALGIVSAVVGAIGFRSVKSGVHRRDGSGGLRNLWTGSDYAFAWDAARTAGVSIALVKGVTATLALVALGLIVLVLAQARG